MRDCAVLIGLLKKARRIYIQTHDFPDHDSLASAFALSHLLAELGMPSRITYLGDIQRESLQVMVETLGIDAHRCERYSISSRDRVVIVDGCKGNRNVSHLPAPELAVIDHHAVDDPEDIAFCDIRPDHGACSSIIFDYYRQMEIQIPRRVATALLIGISMDTAQFTRGAGPADIEAYSALYPLADLQLLKATITNSIQSKDLSFYRTALDNLVIAGRFAFCYFPAGCTQNLMGILADFFLGMRDIDFISLCARNDESVNFSVRCKNDHWNASHIIQEVLNGIGFGGGHRHMAGGRIRDHELFDVVDIYRRFCNCLSVSSEASADADNDHARPIQFLEALGR